MKLDIYRAVATRSLKPKGSPDLLSRRRCRLKVVALAALVLLATGCGEEDDLRHIERGRTIGQR